MTQLSVNVNKLATLRNSRGKNTPDVALLASKILTYGVHGITVHPRPDGRHVRTSDVREIKKLITENYPNAEFNVEGFPSSSFLQLIDEIRPDQTTLVPDPPEALTSNAGWDLQDSTLGPVVSKLKSLGTRVSVFVDPVTFNASQAEALLRVQPNRIELYTERYSDHFFSNERDQVTREYAEVAKFAVEHGIGVNGGHDLNQQNLGFLIRHIPEISEVSIGHALICEALEQGLPTTVKNYLRILETCSE